MDHEKQKSMSSIGGLTSKIVDTLKSEASMPTDLSKTSTTGLPTPSPALKHTSATPEGSGRTESAIRLIVTPLTDLDLTLASDEELVASLSQLLGPLEEVTRSWCGEYGFDCELVGYRALEPRPENVVAQAKMAIRAACAPLPRKEIGKELARLAAAVVSRDRSDLDREAWAEVMIEELSEWPAKTVRDACLRWRRREKFLPSQAEIREECYQAGEKRRALQKLQVVK